MEKIKRGQSQAQQQYIQGFFKNKPCQRQADVVQCSAGQSHPTRRGQVGQQISSPESGNRSESASEDYQQPSTVSAEDRQAHTRTHGHWYVFWVPWTAYWLKLGPLRSVLVFLPLRRPCTRTQWTNSLCHNPPSRLVLVPLLCHPIKKIAPAQLHTVYSFRETLKLNNSFKSCGYTSCFLLHNSLSFFQHF